MAIRIPLREGLFTETPEGALLGCRCEACGQVYFPKTSFCFSCLSEEMVEVKLSRIGTLYSFTRSYLPASHFSPPFTIGWIELPEGIRVFAPIADWERQPLEIGMQMELVIDKLWEEGEHDIIGYTFKPCA